MNNQIDLVLIKTGMLTSIQDSGRVGWQAYGVPVSGAMDLRSYHLANFLVGNAPNTPCLEITLIGPEIRVEGQGQMALTGADLSASINGSAVSINQTFDLNHGDVLSFGRWRSGCRTYLAIHGEWKVSRWLGSCCELPYAEKSKALPPALSKGHRIEIQYRSIPEHRKMEDLTPPNRESIRVMAGPEFPFFSPDIKMQFFEKPYMISGQSNRMGYRLESLLTGYQALPELISSGVVPGVIQVTHSGQLIVLMADAQTTGGYPRIATVLKEDIDILAQLKPGDKIRFQMIE